MSDLRFTACLRVIAVGLTVCTANGCVLAESANAYPFTPVVQINDEDQGTSNNLVKDLPPQDPPFLIFTELLIDAPGADMAVTERGEYIEIKNIGDGPADPREITMFLRDLDNPLGGVRIKVEDGFSDEERAVVDGLQEILPGEYFVFIRYEDPTAAPISAQLPPGFTYDFGRYANGPTLPHQQGIRRQLDLGYSFPDGGSAIFDGIRWDGHELLDPVGAGTPMNFSEGEAVSVDEAFEDAEGNNDPANWCSPPDLVGNVQGTPGLPATCG